MSTKWVVTTQFILSGVTRIILTEDEDTTFEFKTFLKNLEDDGFEYALTQYDDENPLNRSEMEFGRAMYLVNKYYPKTEAEFG